MRPSFFKVFFPHLAECLARRRATRIAKQELRRRQTRYVRPRLEDLEERIVPDAYGFQDPNTGAPSIGAYTTGALWTDFTNPLKDGTVPGANDTADIPVGAVCTLDDGETVRGLTSLSVEGSMALASQLIVSGTTSLSTAGGGAGTMTIGSSNSQEEAKFTTNTFNDNGTATVGEPSAAGSSAEIDAVFLNVGNTSGGAGLLNIGDPGSGHAGSVDVSNTTTVNGGSTLFVGGTDSGGTLDTLSITSSGATTVNTKGEMDIQATGTFAGSTTVTGTIKAENVNDVNGAGVVLDGTGSVSGSDGKLIAEINASFTFVATSAWTIGGGNPVGSALNEGTFIRGRPVGRGHRSQPRRRHHPRSHRLHHRHRQHRRVARFHLAGRHSRTVRRHHRRIVV
jgi:hypothetical protein